MDHHNEIQKVFALERCDVGSNLFRAEKSYTVASLAGKGPIWNRQMVDNLTTTTFNGFNWYYVLNSAPAVPNLADAAWSCVLKKPVVTSTKKNGKIIKQTTPAISDFKVNVTYDGSQLKVWECDDLVQGKYVMVQSLSVAIAWDASAKTPSGTPIWEAAQLDPRMRNWYWACPSGTGARTCYPVTSLR